MQFIKNNFSTKEITKAQFLFFESDNFHLIQFCNISNKINKWIYAPVVGAILYFLIFKTFCKVNLIDKKRAHFNTIKLFSLLFYPQLFLVLIFVAVLIAIIVSPSLSQINTLNKVIYILIPLWMILVISPILSFIIKINLKKILKVDKFSLGNKDTFIYSNARISNNKNYFEKLLKEPNHKINDYFLSDNFKNVNDKVLTENYEGTRIQKMENYAQKQNETINPIWFLMPLAFLIMWISRFFDYFFFCNILAQKAKEDNKINLSKKIEIIVFFNYLLTLIFWASFILFLVTPLTNFSYLSFDVTNLLKPIMLHFIYCFVFLVSFIILSFLRSQIIKRWTIKLCLKSYSIDKSL